MTKITFVNPAIRGTPRIIYTLRHGELDGNALGIDDESLKNKPNHLFPLTQKGYQQISQSAKYIKENEIIGNSTRLYCSGFLRAQQSMEKVLEEKERDSFKVSVDSRLDEWWKGIFHSLSKDEVAEHYGIEKAVQEREGWHHYRPPQGQSGKDVEINLLSFLRDVLDDEIFIVGHGRSLGFLRRLLTNQPVDLNCKYPIPANGEIWKFTKERDYYAFESLFSPEIKEEG